MNALDIGSYAEILNIFLLETGKYLLLLLLVVLAVRLWRQLPRSSGPNWRKMLLFALVTTILAVGVGYYSLCNSLGRLYFHYGSRAVRAGNFASALLLFQTSAKNWKNADALGGEGVSLLWSGATNQGMAFLSEALKIRKKQTPFEEYYEGLYFFYQGQWDTAAPLLAAASAALEYRWNSVILVSVIELEKGNPQEAEKLMAPFTAVDVADYDQAYVTASLDLWKGKKDEAKKLAARYDPASLPPFWKSRFQKLDAQLQVRQP
jgi:hypothetical protein